MFIQHGLAIFRGTDGFDEVVAGDDVAGLTAEDVIQAGLGAAFVAQLLIEGEGVFNAPAAKGVHNDVNFVLGGHSGGRAIPLEDALFEAIDRLNERGLEMKTGLDNRFPDGFAELGDDDLLPFTDGVEGGVEDDDEKDRNEGGEGREEGFHE